MKPVTILPVAHLELSRDDDIFMALLHLVCTSHSYRSFFRARADEGKFVILDDSAVESPEAMSPSLIIEAALAIHANEVVLMDRLRDMRKTLELAMGTFEAMSAKFNGSIPFRLMAVPQGINGAEWIRCARVMAQWSFVNTIGVSYVTTEYFSTRDQAIEIARIPKKSIAYHLLGCFDLVEAVTSARSRPDIRSIDSAIAAVYTVDDVRLDKPQGYSRHHDLTSRSKMDLATLQLNEVMLEFNVDHWRQQILETENI